MKKGMKSFFKGLGNYLKKMTPFWIVCGVVLCFAAVDFANYKSYRLSVVKTFSDENPDGDADKLYYATPEKDEMIYFRVKIESGGKPCSGHTLVAVHKGGGVIMSAREISNPNGEATFSFAVNPVFRNVPSVEANVLFYDESSAWVIEFRVELEHTTLLYRRPNA